MIRFRDLPIVRRRLTSGRHRRPEVEPPPEAEDQPRIPAEDTRPLYREDPARPPRVRMTGAVRALIDTDPEEGR